MALDSSSLYTGTTATSSAAPEDFDAARYRRVLGHYPTGVVIVTACPPDAPPRAMTIGSFSSVSLDPPLVVFYPSKTSASWAKLNGQPSFCINILSWQQESLCRTFASKTADKFKGVRWRRSPSGSPIIEGVVAWIDCDVEEVREAGDHWMVLGRVRALDVESGHLPLLFSHGGYGQFVPLSLTSDDASLTTFLRLADVIRPRVERLAGGLGLECLVAARVNRELVVLAGAGCAEADVRHTRVGRRAPFVAPLGVPIAAWSDPQLLGWFGPRSDPVLAEFWHRELDVVRRRGFHVGAGGKGYAAVEDALSHPDEIHGKVLENAVAQLQIFAGPVTDVEQNRHYEVRTISAPVFTGSPRSVLQLSFHGFPFRITGKQIVDYARLLVETARASSETLGGSPHADAGHISERWA